MLVSFSQSELIILSRAQPRGSQAECDFKVKLSHFAPEIRLFFIDERKPKIFGLNNVMERGIRKIPNFVIDY